MLIIILLLTALAMALGPQVVLSSSFKFSLANVQQCGPVAVTFSGDRPSADDLPLTLTFMPFNSLPISIPISNIAITSPTAWATYVPLEEGSTFVASLDNASGESYGSTSDVMEIQPSSTGNSTCLPSATNSSTPRFSVGGPLSQCRLFNVTYDTTLVNQPPSIRVFTPFHSGFAINETDAPTDGIGTYLMSASRQTEVVLLFDDGLGYREVSDLLTVGGDSNSDNSCVLARKANSSRMDKESSLSQAKLSRGAVIGISLTVGFIVGGVAILVMVYISREGRRRGMRISNFVNSRMIRERSSGNTLSTSAGGFVSRPPYASTKTSESINYNGESARSLMGPTADSQPETILQSSRELKLGRAGSIAGQSVGQQSLSSLDIEYILDMATIYAEPPLPPPPVAIPPQNPSLLTVLPPRTIFPRHLRDPSDVPTDPSPHQSMSGFFPNRQDRMSGDSNSSYVDGRRLIIATQSGLSSYNTLPASQARNTGLPASLRLNATLPLRIPERASSFPVSVTSLSPPRQSWDVEGNPA